MRRPALLALLAAVLFGAGVPFSKRHLTGLHPAASAALLYLGAALALGAWRGLGRRRAESPVQAADLPVLAASAALGGVAAPVLLLWGLSRTAGLAASLLLNLEGVFTALVAWAFFREAVGRRVAGAAFLALAAGAWLTAPGQGATSPLGALAVAGACACWALDNNLTRRLSGRDPVALGLLKSLAAALASLGIALALGAFHPSRREVLAALAIGGLAYGASLVCFVLALRGLGAARTAVLFGLAPFVGALVSVLVLPGERLGAGTLGAGLLMAGASWLLLGERHAHAHVHEPEEHDHRHARDAHHGHDHRGDEGPEPHAHLHRHERLEHAHPHVPDLHHRHGH